MPMDENIVSWNFTNWVTVVLMVAIGLALLNLAQSWYASRQPAAQPITLKAGQGNSLKMAA